MAPRTRLVGKGPSAPARLTIRRLRAQVRQYRHALYPQAAEACTEGSEASSREFGAALSAAYDDAASAASGCEVSMKYNPPVDTGKKQKSASNPIKKELEEEPLLVKALDPVTRKPVAVKREIIEETIIIKRKTIIKREPRPEVRKRPRRRLVIRRRPVPLVDLCEEEQELEDEDDEDVD
mmetsp:Transcript_108379/g.317088  ORF Transcript_108379/g.317088 Transcript_108379/m.317088 type:complete len:180 (-) Transcript_108379:160-699(-)